MLEYPSGTVAFLFTDIEGSTRRWETDQQAMIEAIDRHFARLLESMAASGRPGGLRSLLASQSDAALETFRVFDGSRHKV
jgi:hypothetical protein